MDDRPEPGPPPLTVMAALRDLWGKVSNGQNKGGEFFARSQILDIRRQHLIIGFELVGFIGERADGIDER